MSPDASIIRDVAYIAAMWEASDEAVTELLARDTAAALEGFMQAIAVDEGHWWGLFLHRHLFTVEQMEAAGAPDNVIARLRLEEEAKAGGGDQPIAPEVPARRRARHVEEEDAEQDPPPTLQQLLSQPAEDSDHLILNNLQYFDAQVKELDESGLQELHNRLQRWWPEKPFYEAITWVSERQWRIEYGAQAWMLLAPPADAPVTAEQWAEIAMAGVLFHEQTEWLKAHWSREASEHFATICKSTDAREWHQAMQAMPDPIIDEIADAAADAIETADDDAFGIRYVADRLSAAGRIDAIERLAQVPALRPTLLPALARSGDEGAQHELVDELLSALRRGERPDESRVRWLPEVSDEALLPKLFECLPLVYGVGAPIKDTGQWFRSDVVNPLMQAIRTIGGRGAVEGYDDLIQANPDFQFLRLQRNAILQSMLMHDGLEAAETALSGLGLPIFEASSWG